MRGHKGHSAIAGMCPRWLVLALLLLAWVAVTPLPSRALADPTAVSARVQFFQEYRVQVSGLQNTFEYLVVPQEDDAPQPRDESGAPVERFSLTRDGDLWLTFDVEARSDESAPRLVYHYEFRPAETTLPDGLYYVDLQSTDLHAGINIYYMELQVQLPNSDDGQVIVTPLVHVEGWDGPKVSDPGWRVAYQKPGDNPDDNKPEDDSNNMKDGSSSSTTSASTSPSSSSPSSSPSASSTTGTTSTTESKTTLASTGDTSNDLLPASLAVGSLVLAVGVVLYGRREGEPHA